MTLARSSPLIALSALIPLACTGAARAAVLFSTLGPGDAYATTGGQSVSSFVNVGVKFVLAAPATPTRVTVAMRSAAGSTVTLAICSETSGHPGAALFSTTLAIPAGADPALYTATFAAPVQLAAGVNYWIRASGGSEVWMPNSTGAAGYAFTSTSGAWNQSPAGATPATRLEDDTLASGACCTGSTCSITTVDHCPAANARFAGPGTACNAAGSTTTPCCLADFDQSGTVAVGDIFAYLNAWFAGDPSTDIDGAGLAVSDIFAFLNAWFAGC
jgi:hypothetical protein